MSVVPLVGAFGSGGDEPWARIMTDGGGPLWALHDDGARIPLDTARWAAGADAVDRRAIEALPGPVLDVGCGPGRMVRAALDAGLPALGIDVSAAAVRRCRADGIPVLRRDVFGPVPRPGTWGAALLFDGNVGIGGDVPALLARLRDLLAPDGVAVAEVHSEQDRHERTLSRVVDARGRISAPFSWATVGEQPLVAAATGFRLERAWSDGGRRFVRLRRTADAAG